MKIEKKALSEIYPYYNNPRDNSKAVGPVMESFKKFGFIKPIIVDKNMLIIAGHTRYIAAYQLGLEYVPVIVSDMDEEQAKMFRIADNKLAEKSEFDEDQLIEELRAMKVPQEMQSFFFEDIDTMLNFSLETFNQQAEDMGGFTEYSPDDAYDSYEEQETVSEEQPQDESENEEEDDDLFKVKKRDDGTMFMKVICPYCGNVETIEIEE